LRESSCAEINMTFGWWDFGLEIGLVQKGGGGVSRTSENECITSESADMGNWVLANTARASEKNDHAWAPKAN